MSGRRAVRIAAIAGPLLLLLPLHLNGLARPRSIRQHDEGIYVVLGRSLAAGEGYRLASVPGAPPAVKYPPGLPAALAALFAVAGDGETAWFAARASAIAVALAFALAGGALAARAAGAPPWAGAGVALAIGAWPPLVEDSAMLLSDAPFALLAVLALGAAGGAGPPRAAMAALLALAALGTRAAGIAVVAAVATALWRAGVRRAAAVTIGAAAASTAAWALRTAAVAPAYATPLLRYYLGYGSMEYAVLSPADIGRIFLANVGRTVLSAPSGAFGPALLPPAIAAIAGGLALVAAAVRSVRARGADPVDLFLVVYVAGVATFPALDDRYLFPVLPAVAASLFRMAAACRRPAAGFVVLALGLAAWGLALARPADVRLGVPLDRADLASVRPRLAAALDWIDAHAPAGAPIAGALDPYLHLVTGRPAVRPYLYDPARLRGVVAGENPLGTPDEVDRSLRDLGVGILVDDDLVPGPEGAEARRLLERIVDDPARGWRSVFDSGGVAVYLKTGDQ